MDWTGLRVVIIGAARQGSALARYLSSQGARVIMNDQRSLAQLGDVQADLAGLAVEWVTGGHPQELLERADMLCPSGGVPLTIPLLREARARGIPLSNDSQIFLEAAPCKVIGITGSAGKTTTTTLVGRMAEASCHMNAKDLKDSPYPWVHLPSSAWIGGNIGTPLISDLDEMLPGDLAVMELSSFQLEIMTRSPQIAAVLNITPNHLDRHGTMQAYTAAKARILDFQMSEDVAVLNRDDPGAWSQVEKVRGKLISFGFSQPALGKVGIFVEGDQICYWDGHLAKPLLPVSLNLLRGDHNLANVLAACAIGAAAGLPVEALRAGIEGFRGVAHRLEFVRSWGGADWYNDSIATAPERAIAAIRSFEEPIVLLAGGRDKDLPWEDFASLVHQRVDHLILFGEAAGKISRAIGATEAGQRPLTMESCKGLQEAIQAAAKVVEMGDVVLLSPGGTSFDEFRDFEARGEAYRQWVLELL